MTISHLCPPDPYLDKEARYLRVRTLEDRVCSDDFVRHLPKVPADYPHYREWCMRANSAKAFLTWIQGRAKPCRILDLGCGNGWLANHIAAIPGTKVHGLDLNLRELQQADRVFGDRENLQFCYGDLFQSIFPQRHFDLVLMASSVQYFPSLTALVNRLFDLLDNRGEIHILDSPFYRKSDRRIARTRSLAYYTNLGLPEMADDYHHHGLDTLLTFRPRMAYNPRAWWPRLQRKLLGRHLSPFPWVVIQKPDYPSSANSRHSPNSAGDSSGLSRV